MKLQEAFKELELDESATQDEIKKKFRQLSKKYHPDVNKDKDAEAKFKRVSEAHDILKDPTKAEDNQTQFQGNPFQGGFGGINIQDIFNGFQGFNQQRFLGKERHTNHAIVHITISFAESIMGCTKTIEFQRYVKCDDNSCDGLGGKAGEKCIECNGSGMKSNQQKHNNQTFITRSQCNKCNGAGGKVEYCKKCSGYGSVSSQAKFEVKLVAGLNDGQQVRLNGAGNYIAEAGGYDAGWVIVKVKSEPEFKRIDNNIYSEVQISLVEALNGVKKKIKNVDGAEEEITINKLAKNKDNIVLKHKGVGYKNNDHRQKGDQIVEIIVNYPADIDKLVEYLNKT